MSEHAAEPRFLVVDSEDDPLSQALMTYARHRDIPARRIRLDGFARTVSVDVAGGDATVAPTIPLLIRPVQPAGEATDADARFMFSEWFGAAWSAAALMPAPVLNRPDEWGWIGRYAPSAAATERRARGSVRAPETFWSGSPPGERFVHHQNLDTWANADSAAGIRHGRSRALPAMLGWEQVIVVGERPFRVTAADLGGHDVDAGSVEVARALGLTFATVSWGIPADRTAPVLTRVNPYPAYGECAPVLPSVCAALIGELLP